MVSVYVQEVLQRYLSYSRLHLKFGNIDFSFEKKVKCLINKISKVIMKVAKFFQKTLSFHRKFHKWDFKSLILVCMAMKYDKVSLYVKKNINIFSFILQQIMIGVQYLEIKYTQF